MSSRALVALVLGVSVAATAVGVIDSKHRSRRLFVELQELKQVRDRLNVEWGRLRLEQGAWATHGRIEKTARQQLEMHTPPQRDIVIVALPR